MTRHITASFGISYIEFPNKSLTPFIGLRYSITPVNKWVRQGMQEMTYQGSRTKYSLDRMAIDIGFTLNSIEDSANRIKNTFAKVGLLTGIGYRLTNYTYFSIGRAWYNEVDESNKNKSKLEGKLYVSLALDWDIARTFNSVGKLIGIAY